MKSHSESMRPFAVGVAGLGPRGWHLLERFSLRDDVCIASVWDASPALRQQAEQQRWTARDSPDALYLEGTVHGVAITCGVAERAELIERCLIAGKHVLTEPPVAPSAHAAARLYDLSDERGVCLWAASPRRWEDDVRAARLTVRSGRLGELRALRLTSAEWAPWAQLGRSRPVEEARTTLELIAPHMLDQLGELTAADAIHVSATPFPSEHGFLAVLQLADGAVVHLDLRRRSLAGLQTGWLLEGESAGYRGLRLYTPTTEGEIVDEPVRVEPLPGDPLIDDWLARCRRRPSGSDRARGVWQAAIYERLSTALGEAVERPA